jgi:hypothetical protein
MMIFGFNSDVQCGETVYHVQSEFQPKKHRLETHIFVQGRCVGRHIAPFSDANIPSEQEIQEMLRAQHREVLEALRAGRLEQYLSPGSEI